MSDDLWSTGDIGSRLGISAERARQLSHRDSFPAPVVDRGKVRLWRPDAVEAWITEHRPDKAR